MILTWYKILIYYSRQSQYITPNTFIFALWEYSQKAYFWSVGVLVIHVFQEYSQRAKISILGVLPVSKNKSIGSIPRTFRYALQEYYIMYNKHSHWHKISLLGVLPERKNKPSGSTPRVSNGSNISRLYIMSSLLPMYNFWLFGSTPGSAIPFLWECSHKSGPRNMFVNTGVLPMPSWTIFVGALPQTWYSSSGSTPEDPK